MVEILLLEILSEFWILPSAPPTWHGPVFSFFPKTLTWSLTEYAQQNLTALLVVQLHRGRLSPHEMMPLCNLLNGMRVTTKWCYTEYADRLTCPIHYLSKSFLFSRCLRASIFSLWVPLVPCISKVLSGLVWVAEVAVVSAHIKPLLDWVQINAASLIQQPPGEYLSVSFYSLSFSALSLYSLQFPLIPSSSMWTMIWVTTDPHRSAGNILKSYVLREKGV